MSQIDALKTCSNAGGVAEPSPDERSTRKLRLTPDGELLLEGASRLIMEADVIEHLMRDRDEEPRGRLRVSVPVMLGQQIKGQVAADYTARWPKTAIDVVLTDRKSHLIEENFDCAISIGPLKDSSYIAERLVWSHPILVASPKLLADRPQPSSLRRFPTGRQLALPLRV